MVGGDIQPFEQWRDIPRQCLDELDAAHPGARIDLFEFARGNAGDQDIEGVVGEEFANRVGAPVLILFDQDLDTVIRRKAAGQMPVEILQLVRVIRDGRVQNAAVELVQRHRARYRAAAGPEIEHFDLVAARALP